MGRGAWRIRLPDEEFSVVGTNNDNNLFTFNIFHGGEFSQFPGRAYEGGRSVFIDNVEVGKIGKGDLVDMARNLGYPPNEVLYFHYRELNVCMDWGIHPLCDKFDFKKIFNIVKGGIKVVDIYVEHGHSRLINNASFASQNQFENEKGHEVVDVDIEYTSNRLNEEEGKETDSHESGSYETEDDSDYTIEEIGYEYLEDVEVDMTVFKNNVDADVVEVYNATDNALDDYEDDEHEKSSWFCHYVCGLLIQLK
ncbi:uncharacterized protein LOC143589176 [Bidens hawaiensis]|uniref:uncharacterized protein LOC143589176 n=1 Tax=Bidens hawaiensis TaxID=980011 RepID=UPI0040496D99